ncbi:MAG: TonB-dependent receptor [Cyclobacteriaceae bacterium]
MNKKFLHFCKEGNEMKLSTFLRMTLFTLAFVVASLSTAYSQTRTLTGTVSDATGTLPGVAVIEKGTTNGTNTDAEGNFALRVDESSETLVFSFIGMESQEIAIGNQTNFNIVLKESVTTLEEIVVVGYGEQKKESVVGAIVQTKGEDLKRAGGVVNVAQALTGQLPGVTVIQGTGEPGADDPRILIRAQGSWNNSNPLILVDGVERRMNDIDVNEIESISVLKDASATAVFGVKGAEGVILITTKRGKSGAPKFTLDMNSNVKFLSKTPDKLNSYEGFLYRNNSIEYELPVTESSWGNFQPMEMVNRYRQPQAPGDEYIFPDVDWPKEQLKDFALSHRLNFNVSGGTKTARYFGSLSYTHDGDLLNSGLDNGKGYKTKNAYERFNFRTNLDLDITKTTTFSVNVAGYVGTKFGTPSQDIWRPFYQSAPHTFPARFPDGAWGFTPLYNIPNPLYLLNNSGRPTTTRTQVNTDFILQQKLDFILEGLSFRGLLAYDNLFYSSGGITDGGNAPTRYIDPMVIYMKDGETIDDYTQGTNAAGGINEFDWVQQPITYRSENSSDLNNAYRRLFYQNQLNFARVFDNHDVGATIVMTREQFAEGSMFPRYREDWVGRVTYAYDDRYLFETNGAYNGSEKFAKEYRFGFFPSVAVGWRLSNESFLQTDWIDNLKIRYSIGKVGNDNFSAPRWAYDTQWKTDDRTNFGTGNNASPYTQYTEAVIGNPDLQWETALKQNLGIEFAVFQNKIGMTADFFRDHRTNIFMSAGQRRISDYFGALPVSANLGETKSHGYELTLNLQNQFKELHYWGNISYTYAKDEVIYMEDPALLSGYQKAEGYQIGQMKTVVSEGYVDNWDELYATTYWQAQNQLKLPGDQRLLDFNADGVINSFDVAPYGYPTRPQNTYNFSFGLNYKGFSLMAQFYGVYNVSRVYGWFLRPYSDAASFVVFENNLDQWTPENTNPTWPAQRTNSSYQQDNLYTGDRWIQDASFLRLKTAEIAYSMSGTWLKAVGASSARIYLNGNNLFFWSDLMDDQEGPGVSNGAGYPVYRRVNLGLNVNF